MVGNIACTVGLYADDACFIEIVNNSPAIPAAKINSHLYITGLYDINTDTNKTEYTFTSPT